MCLSNGGVTLRNGHSAHTRNGLAARTGTASPQRTGTASRADRNGFPPQTGTAGRAGEWQAPGWPRRLAAGTATFMNEARGYGPNC